MSHGLGATVIGITIVILVFVIVAGVIPYLYNKNLESKQTSTNYCDDLHAQIAASKSNLLNSSIIVNEENNYKSACSG